MTIGDAELSVSLTVPRCVMTTLAQGDLPADRNVLRSIADHNKVNPFAPDVDEATYPCVGVYAEVVTEGDVRSGDEVYLS